MSLKAMRKWISLAIAIVLYYIVHEGAHLVVALLFGTFQSIHIANWGLGVQIVANTGAMSDMQIFWFCIMGVIATLIVGYILVGQRKNISKIPSDFVKAILYYATIIFLFLDPFYLSIAYRFVGGGDFNGIVLIGIPEMAVFIFFSTLFVLHLFIFLKLVYPAYKQGFMKKV